MRVVSQNYICCLTEQHQQHASKHTHRISDLLGQSLPFADGIHEKVSPMSSYNKIFIFSILKMAISHSLKYGIFHKNTAEIFIL